MRYRVWWVPQIPGTPFHYEVQSVEEARLLLDALARYDLFLLEHNHRVDFANSGGLEVFDPQDDTDGPDGSWTEWMCDECAEDADGCECDTPTGS